MNGALLKSKRVIDFETNNFYKWICLLWDEGRNVRLCNKVCYFFYQLAVGLHLKC